MSRKLEDVKRGNSNRKHQQRQDAENDHDDAHDLLGAGIERQQIDQRLITDDHAGRGA